MILAVAGVALAIAAPAPDLQARLPVQYPVTCASTTEEWAAETSQISLPATSNAFTRFSDRSIHVSPWVCASLRSTPTSAYLLTLYHEFIHAATLTRVESTADCLSLFLYRYWVRRFWGYTVGQAQQLYEGAWTYHITKPAEYQGTCTFEAKDTVSYANGL